MLVRFIQLFHQKGVDQKVFSGPIHKVCSYLKALNPIQQFSLAPLEVQNTFTPIFKAPLVSFVFCWVFSRITTRLVVIQLYPTLQVEQHLFS